MDNVTAGFVQFDLVSPERKLVSEMVSMIVIPGTEGDFGVQPSHMPLVSTLRHGVISVYHVPEDQHPTRFFVEGGFADVTAGQCTVLAEYAVKIPEIDQDALSEEITALYTEMQGVHSDEDLDAIRKKLDIAIAKQEAISLHR